MVTILNSYILGDMKVHYYLDQTTKMVEMVLLPEGIEPLNWETKKQKIDAMVQLKIVGETYPGGYSGGNSMRQGTTSNGLCYKKQERIEDENHIQVITTFSHTRGYEVVHHMEWEKGAKTVETYTTLTNTSGEDVLIEMISSFSLGGISPFLEGDGHEKIMVHRLRSVWSMEGRLESRSIEDLQLEPSWADHAVRSERFGQVGSMAVNKYFPYLAIEDKENEVVWGAQLAHNASWQMEVYRIDEGISISGGLADREFGHWMKEIKKDEIFVTPRAILSVCKGGGLDRLSHRLTSANEKSVDRGPVSEQSLPIVFNEYCTTWGNPSHTNICKILEAIDGRGFDYFVIDCGWYKEAGVPWDISMGDYNVSKELFPDGLEKTVTAIRVKGLKPGIWFEIDNVGEASNAYKNTDHLLKRDGHVLTTTMRRFWNLQDPYVEKYLTDKVIGTLKKYQFDYMKIDYNDTIGLGCDGAESIGEGLRQNMNASIGFLDKVHKELPGIIIENCASGGQKLEPLMMSKASMASFSDAHECEEIPIIAANLHRAILPRQSQIWAVIRKTDSLKRIAYSVANTFLGRMCLSGDVLELSKEQWYVIQRGIEFYRLIAPLIKNGYTSRFGTVIKSYRHPKGWQGILRKGLNGDAYLLIHVFGGVLENVIEIDLLESYTIVDTFSDTEVDVSINEGKFSYTPLEHMKAIALYLKKNKEV